MPVPVITKSPIPYTVASAFGRVFYGADTRIYFSPLIRNVSDIGRCYQRNDPTSDEVSDLLATDGGVIYLDDVTGIVKMVRFRENILVLARNGVWAISGGETGFAADAYTVSRVSYRGCTHKDSVVVGEDSVLYFADEGIIRLAYNAYGTIQDQDITQESIRSFYIEYFAPYDVCGNYDPTNKEVWWWHKTSNVNLWSESPSTSPAGLVLETSTGAFFPQQAAFDENFTTPLAIDGEFYHLRWQAIKPTTPLQVRVSFQTPTDENFEDHAVFSSTTSTYQAFLQSGPEALGKPGNSKGVVESTFFFERTETQVTGFDGVDYEYDKPSSCYLITKWDFDSSRHGNKWIGDSPDYLGSGKGSSDYRQIYDPNVRGFIPSTFPVDLDDGYGVVSKRVRLRGSGRAVTFLFASERGKDMQMLGYSVAYTMKGRL